MICASLQLPGVSSTWMKKTAATNRPASAKRMEVTLVMLMLLSCLSHPLPDKS